MEASKLELYTHRLFVHVLEIARTKGAVDFGRGADHAPGECVGPGVGLPGVHALVSARALSALHVLRVACALGQTAKTQRTPRAHPPNRIHARVPAALLNTP